MTTEEEVQALKNKMEEAKRNIKMAMEWMPGNSVSIKKYLQRSLELLGENK